MPCVKTSEAFYSLRRAAAHTIHNIRVTEYIETVIDRTDKHLKRPKAATLHYTLPSNLQQCVTDRKELTRACVDILPVLSAITIKSFNESIN